MISLFRIEGFMVLFNCMFWLYVFFKVDLSFDDWLELSVIVVVICMVIFLWWFVNKLLNFLMIFGSVNNLWFWIKILIKFFVRFEILMWFKIVFIDFVWMFFLNIGLCINCVKFLLLFKSLLIFFRLFVMLFSCLLLCVSLKSVKVYWLDILEMMDFLFVI